MAKTIATIRAANLLPLVRWLEANGRPTQMCLNQVDLGYWFGLAPEDPIPLTNAIKFLRNCARENGPDFGCQVVGASSVGELAYIGRVALGTRTPAEAFQRISAVLKLHSSHETIQIDQNETGLRVTEAIQVPLDTESLHAVHVLFSAMIQQVCLFTGLRTPLLERIEMVPHPDYGLDHLQRWFGDRIHASKEPRIAIHINTEVADRPFKTIAKDRLPRLMQMSIPPLAEDASLAGSMRPLFRGMLHDGEPSIDSIAASGLMSVRTLQRRLKEEGTSFSAELETVRKALAFELLGDETSSIEEISNRMGYSSPSALSRAVRRLTGAPPSAVRLTAQS